VTDFAGTLPSRRAIANSQSQIANRKQPSLLIAKTADVRLGDDEGWGLSEWGSGRNGDWQVLRLGLPPSPFGDYQSSIVLQRLAIGYRLSLR